MFSINTETKYFQNVKINTALSCRDLFIAKNMLQGFYQREEEEKINPKRPRGGIMALNIFKRHFHLFVGNFGDFDV